MIGIQGLSGKKFKFLQNVNVLGIISEIVLYKCELQEVWFAIMQIILY